MNENMDLGILQHERDDGRGQQQSNCEHQEAESLCILATTPSDPVPGADRIRPNNAKTCNRVNLAHDNRPPKSFAAPEADSRDAFAFPAKGLRRVSRASWLVHFRVTLSHTLRPTRPCRMQRTPQSACAQHRGSACSIILSFSYLSAFLVSNVAT